MNKNEREKLLEEVLNKKRNISVDEGSLNDFEGMISDLEKIKNYYNLKRFNISISELCNVKKIKLIVSKYENL